MRWFLACALLMGAGCGESEERQGTTIVTIAFPGPEIYTQAEVSCVNDPPPSEDEVRLGLECATHAYTGECLRFFHPPPGPCTLLITLRDEDTGETICVQEEDFVVSEVGDTEVDITTLDNCEPVTMP